MAKTSEIKLFQSMLKFCQMMGIHPTVANQTYRFNGRNLTFLLSTAQVFTTTAAFFIFRAQTLQEHASTFHGFLTKFTMFIFVLIHTREMPNTLELIQKFEDFIEKRKYK